MNGARAKYFRKSAYGTDFSFREKTYRTTATGQRVRVDIKGMKYKRDKNDWHNGAWIPPKRKIRRVKRNAGTQSNTNIV